MKIKKLRPYILIIVVSLLTASCGSNKEEFINEPFEKRVRGYLQGYHNDLTLIFENPDNDALAPLVELLKNARRVTKRAEKEISYDSQIISFPTSPIYYQFKNDLYKVPYSKMTEHTFLEKSSFGIIQLNTVPIGGIEIVGTPELIAEPKGAPPNKHYNLSINIIGEGLSLSKELLPIDVLIEFETKGFPSLRTGTLSEHKYGFVIQRMEASSPPKVSFRGAEGKTKIEVRINGAEYMVDYIPNEVIHKQPEVATP